MSDAIIKDLKDGKGLPKLDNNSGSSGTTKEQRGQGVCLEKFSDKKSGLKK